MVLAQKNMGATGCTKAAATRGLSEFFNFVLGDLVYAAVIIGEPISLKLMKGGCRFCELSRYLSRNLWFRSGGHLESQCLREIIRVVLFQNNPFKYALENRRGFEFDTFKVITGSGRNNILL